MTQAELAELKDWTLALTSRDVKQKQTCQLLFAEGLLAPIFDKWLF